MMSGPSIYFARAGHDGPIKIGYTKLDPRSRLANLQTGCPAVISLMASVPGSAQDEARLHDIFDDLRVLGEWFRPDGRLLDAIADLVAGVFVWPEPQRVASPPRLGEPRALVENPTIGDIIWACGGPTRISVASRGSITPDAVHKWRVNTIQWWHWDLIMSLCGASAVQLYEANKIVRKKREQRRAA